MEIIHSAITLFLEIIVFLEYYFLLFYETLGSLFIIFFFDYFWLFFFYKVQIKAKKWGEVQTNSFRFKNKISKED